MAKVYTKTGDKGTTGLADGTRLHKNHVRIESYGNIDELNSLVGICRQSLVGLLPQDGDFLDSWLFAIQNDLFNLGSDLATPLSSRWKNMILVGAEEVLRLEKLMDFCQESLPPLTNFVLPGGTALNAQLHLARTVCRRAERSCVTLSQMDTINEWIIPYVNRLSDLFFVLSRWVQLKLGKDEVLWDKKGGTISLGELLSS